MQSSAKSKGGIFKGHPAASFFILTFVLSWALWIPVALSSLGVAPFGVQTGTGAILILIGAFSPSLSGIVMAGLTEGRQGIRRMLGRLFKWRIGVSWYLVTLFLVPVVSLFALRLFVLLGNETPEYANLDKWYLLPLIFIQVLLLGGPLQEEIGWRGYALPRLQSHQTALVSGSVVGLLWGLWHLPLFLVPYSSQYGIPFLGFVLIDVALGILFAWVYNNTGSSLLLSLFLHTSVNVTSWFLPIAPKASGSDTPIWLIAGLLSIAALLVTFAFGPQRLSRKTWQIVDPYARQH
jgi:membrane protease YdiL (CAAX protease family)